MKCPFILAREMSAAAMTNGIPGGFRADSGDTYLIPRADSGDTVPDSVIPGTRT